MASSMTAYQRLHSHFDKIGELENIAEISHWDEATMMPEGSGETRGRSLATLSGVIHDLKTDPKISEWLDESEGDNSLDQWQKANLFEIRRIFAESSVIPTDLAQEIERSSSLSEQAWRKLRANNDWASMMPLLSRVVELVREKAKILADAKGLSAYDALLDQYEPGLTSETINLEFSKLKAFLPNFIDNVIEIQGRQRAAPLKGTFEITKQRQLGIQIMKVMGFNFNKGRLDVSHHPFCGGTPDDTRITTRYNEESFEESLMGVIHETGHALYEQGLSKDRDGLPVQRALSMGIHESQSLFWERYVGQSREFWRAMHPAFLDAFPRQNPVPPSPPALLHAADITLSPFPALQPAHPVIERLEVSAAAAREHSPYRFWPTPTYE